MTPNPLSRSTTRRCSVAAILLLSACTFACSDIFPTSAATESRGTNFELQKDKQGRLVRVNKATGEVMVVRGARRQPAARAGAPLNQTAKRAQHVPSATTARAAVNSTIEIRSTKPMDSSIASLEPVDLSIRESRTTAAAWNSGVPIGQPVVITAADAVFVTPNSSQRALRVAGQFTRFRLVGIEGDWYQVEWNEASLGRRVGFVQTKNVVVSAPDAQMRPVDLSIREMNSGVYDPVDISVKEAKKKVPR